jgi:citrate synthase
MTETNEPIKVHRGLRGVYFDRLPCTFIDGKVGNLRYRGYSIHDLAERSTFEETAWLLLNGELPTRAQLTEFEADLRAARTLPGAIIDVIGAVMVSMDVPDHSLCLVGIRPDAADNNACRGAAQDRPPRRRCR